MKGRGKKQGETRSCTLTRNGLACHDATEAYELSLSDMQIPLILNHSEAVVIKTKHRLKAINPHNKAIISF